MEKAKKRLAGEPWKLPFHAGKKTRLVFWVSVIVVVLILVAAILMQIFVYSNNAVVMQVDGYPVTREEFEFHMGMEKTSVSNYFYQAYGVNLSGKSWDEEYGGEKPIEVLREKAKQSVIQAKTLQIMALKHGITGDISYKGMKSGLASINKQRREQMAAGETLYGVVEFTPLTYYQQVMGNYKTKVKEKVMDVEVFVDEQQTRDLYEENYDYYNNEQNIKVAELFVPYLPEGEQPTESVTMNYDKAYSVTEEIYDKLQKGEDFYDVCREYTGDPPVEITLSNAERGNNTERMFVYYTQDLKEGDISEPFLNGFGFSVLKMLDTSVESQMSYEEAYPYLYNIAMEQNYETFLAQSAASGKTLVRGFVLSKIGVP